MSVNVLAPSAGESVTEIEISQWNMADGDGVKKDQIIAIAETEKATLEIRSPVEGKLKILSPAGSVVSPGTPVASVEEGVVETKESSEKSPPIPLSAQSPSTTAKEPAKPSSPSPTEVGQTVPAQAEVLRQGQANQASQANQANQVKVASQSKAPVYASPSVRKMIVENDIDINQIQGSQGHDSPIGEEEVMAFLRQRSAFSSAEESVGQPNILIGKDRKTTSRKMTRLRQTIAKRLVEAQHNAALLTTFNEIDMGSVMAIRNQYKELFKKKHEVGLGFMSFFVKAVCQALMEFPIINSMVEEDMIIEPNYADIGIAVSTPKGLVVPVIRDAQSLNFKEIEKTISNYGRMGKEGSIPIDDLTGGTFTITNGGTFGSMLSTPIINPPQSAILGMHNIVERPVVKNGEIVIRPIMYVALSYDHRLIDGADSVRFLYRIKEFIEDPNRLLVGI